MNSVGAAATRLNDILLANIPGKSRVFTKEEIAKEYGERATRPIPIGYSPKTGIRGRLLVNYRFNVYKVFETGKTQWKSGHQTWEEAEKEAGRLRDAMSDEECSKDYSYEARERKNGRK